jgi:hypothetical protein
MCNLALLPKNDQVKLRAMTLGDDWMKAGELAAEVSTEGGSSCCSSPRAASHWHSGLGPRVSFGDTEVIYVNVDEPASPALARRDAEGRGAKARDQREEPSCFAGLPSRENAVSTSLCIIAALGFKVGLTPLALLIAGVVKAKGTIREERGVRAPR